MLSLSARALRITITGLVAIFYIALVLHTHDYMLEGDEIRYVEDAVHLREGSFIQDNQRVINGPGYPIMLMPFVGHHESWIWARFVNVACVTGAVWILFGFICRRTNPYWALASASAVGFNPSILKWVPTLMCEPVSLFCVTAVMASFERVIDAPRLRWAWIFLCSLSFAWLVMNKVIFGYVAMVGLALSCVAWLLHKPWRDAWLRTAIICAGTLVLCLPYLMHTSAKTGKLMCWSTTGGEMLYWMTSTRPGEDGHWHDWVEVQDRPELLPQREFYLNTFKENGPERDRLLSARAKEQLAANPTGVLYNWVCNQCRIWFAFPRSFEVEKLNRIAYIIWNSPLLLGLILCISLGWRRWISIGPIPSILMGLAVVYLGGQSLAPAQPRYLVVVLPLIWTWVSVLFHRWVRLSVEVNAIDESVRR
jgi:hypothetical protein